MLEQAAQNECGCSVSGGVQVGRGPEQTDLMLGVVVGNLPRGLELDP